ncbi:hypothetical protein [Halosegnis marinus]|uniref:Uncharacterized protein n=1 Tax=Halosegnis marinus TaxID=3034023 RepID=A0ABD5ZTW4_9EURY|nr:hypothetical protein [Halosegnis sp. DT85]
MDKQNELYEEITPILTEDELDELLNLTSGPLDSAAKLQRDAFRRHIRERSEDEPDKLRVALQELFKWDNYPAAIALWAGYIEKADSLRSEARSFQSSDAIEYALIERVGQPVYNSSDFGKDELDDAVTCVLQTSAVAQYRPEFWADDEKARARVVHVLDKELEDVFSDDV